MRLGGGGTSSMQGHLMHLDYVMPVIDDRARSAVMDSIIVRKLELPVLWLIIANVSG